MVIGVVLADTHENACACARAVKVHYGDDLPAFISIEEAIAGASFYPDVRILGLPVLLILSCLSLSLSFSHSHSCFTAF